MEDDLRCFMWYGSTTAMEGNILSGSCKTRPTMLYGIECWAVKKQHENKLSVTKMRMLRWICGKTRWDKIRNDSIRDRVGVAPIVEKMVETWIRCLCYMISGYVIW